MLTKPCAELTLFDTLSRLTVVRAMKLLGADRRSPHCRGRPARHRYHHPDQIRSGSVSPQGRLSTTVTLALSPAARNCLEWHSDTCDALCEHASAAFSLIQEEKLALGLADAPPERGQQMRLRAP
jgi:hypothetical protein